VQAKTGLSLPIPSVLGSFEVQGPNGIHRCCTIELMQGDLRTASYSRLFPIRVARALAAKLVLAVDYVHSRDSVHGCVLAVWYLITGSWLIYLPQKPIPACGTGSEPMSEYTSPGLPLEEHHKLPFCLSRPAFHLRGERPSDGHRTLSDVLDTELFYKPHVYYGNCIVSSFVSVPNR
jgi:hypothetical protein